MNNFEKRTMKKKEAITMAALTLFGEQGFSTVSIKTIAAAAQVSQVSIYNYFGNKEALVLECAKHIMVETLTLADEILAEEEPFHVKIEKALNLCNQQLNLSLSSYLTKEAAADVSFTNLLFKDINALKKEMYMKYIHLGKQEHALPDISDETIQLFIDALNSISLSISEEEMTLRQTEIIHLFLYGLMGEKKQTR